MNWLIYAKLIAVTFFWGGTFVAGRVVAQSMPIELAGTLRFVIAADWLRLIYLGAFGTVLAFVWYADGIRKIGAARTVIFNNLVPLYAVVLGYLLLNEPIHWSMPVGDTVSFAGVLPANKRGGSSLKAAE